MLKSEHGFRKGGTPRGFHPQLPPYGLHTVGDLLTYYPRSYEDRRQVYTIRRAPAEEKVCIQGMIAEHPRLTRIRRGLDLVKARAVDHSGSLSLTFFNQSYVEKALSRGRNMSFMGRWRNAMAAAPWSTPSLSPRGGRT